MVSAAVVLYCVIVPLGKQGNEVLLSLRAQ
jgi:hypothetical protein